MRISDWSSDVCSSDLQRQPAPPKQEDREPPADPRGKAAETITLHWPDGKTREFPRTIAGAKEFVKAAKSAVATNRAVYEVPATKERLSDIKEKIPELLDDIIEIEDLFANPVGAAAA